MHRDNLSAPSLPAWLMRDPSVYSKDPERGLLVDSQRLRILDMDVSVEYPAPSCRCPPSSVPSLYAQSRSPDTPRPRHKAEVRSNDLCVFGRPARYSALSPEAHATKRGCDLSWAGPGSNRALRLCAQSCRGRRPIPGSRLGAAKPLGVQDLALIRHSGDVDSRPAQHCSVGK